MGTGSRIDVEEWPAGRTGLKTDRVAVLIDRLVVGGVEKAAIEEVRMLRELGIDAILIVLKREPAPAAFRDVLASIPVDYLDDRLPKMLRSSLRIPGFTFFSLFHLIYALTLPLRVHVAEWSVIIVHNSYSALTAWTLSRLRGIPYCMFVWDPIGPLLARVYQTGLIRLLRPMLMPLGRAVDRLLARDSQQLFVSSYSYMPYLGRLLRNRRQIVAVPPGCFPRASPRKHVGGYVLSATSWKRGKQAEVLLRAIAPIRNMRAVIAGGWLSVEYKAEVEALVSDLGLEDRVRFDGEYDDAAMANLAAHALCSVTMNAELGFGMPSLEAAAQACTFICPRASGIAAFFVEGTEAFYFDEGDVTALTAKLRMLSDQPERAYEAGNEAWLRARSSLTWRHHAETLARGLGALG